MHFFGQTARDVDLFQRVAYRCLISLYSVRWIAVFILLCMVGCTRNQYEIKLKPEAEVMHRSLTTWRQTVQAGKTDLVTFPDPELQQIAKAYNKPAPPGTARKFTFQGKFVGETPPDIGGSGNHTFWKTRMGSLSLYTERFRGNDDLAAALDDRQNAADTLTTLLQGWFKAEIGDDPDFQKLEQFMDHKFRRDMRNLALYFWTVQAVSESEVNTESAADNSEMLVRITRYLMERDYLTPAMLPELIRSVEQKDSERFLKFVRTLVASQLQIDNADQIARRLSFLKSPEIALLSLKKYLATTKEYETFLRQWQHDHKDQPDATPPEPVKFMNEQAWQMTGIMLGGADQLKVKLTCPTQPFSTNGTWNKETSQVVWSTRINIPDKSSGSVLPAMLFAFWSVPNDEFQRKHFGMVVLSGESLAKYCTWKKALTETESKEWDAFISSLTPGNNLLKRNDTFRFSIDPQPSPTSENKPTSLADTPRDLIKNMLKPK